VRPPDNCGTTVTSRHSHAEKAEQVASPEPTVKQDNLKQGPRTGGYDNNHILFAVLIVFGVLAIGWYGYTTYIAPAADPLPHTTAPASMEPTGLGQGTPDRP
jgi:hypothetical protein